MPTILPHTPEPTHKLNPETIHFLDTPFDPDMTSLSELPQSMRSEGVIIPHDWPSTRDIVSMLTPSSPFYPSDHLTNTTAQSIIYTSSNPCNPTV